MKLTILQAILITIFLGGLYYKFEDGYLTNDLQWRKTQGFFMIVSIMMGMIGLMPIALIFPSEREVFLKEENSRLYSTSCYFLSRTIVQIPQSMIISLIETIIIYWFVGLTSTVSQFLTFYLISFLLTYIGVALGLAIGSIITD